MPLLREYQERSVYQLAEALKTHQRVIFRLDTGGGKTVVFSEIAARATLKGTVTLILTDRKELFKQSHTSIERHNIPVCKIDAKNKIIYLEAKLYVAMVETIARRLEKLLNINFGLIIIDEAHKGCFFKIMDAFPNVKVIGATATPINKKLHKYYTHMVDVTNIPELVAQGFLMPCIPYQKEDDFTDLVVEKNGEEFNETSLFTHFNKSNLYAGVVEDYIAKANGKKAVVFNVNIEHAMQMTKAFNDAGIKSFCITSETKPADRDYILDQYSKGAFKVLNNCGILTTGWDEPTVEVVIVNRATLSLALWLQMCGRGSRPCIEIGKKFFIVLDFGMNHNRHGLWEETRTWSLAPPVKKRKGGGVGVCPVKTCENIKCKQIISALAAVCKFCGHTYKVDLVLKEGKLVQVKPQIPEEIVDKHIGELSIEELVELQKTKLHTPIMIWRVISTRGEEAIRKYAGLMSYNTGWIDRQLEGLKESKEKGIEIKFNNYKVKQVMA